MKFFALFIFLISSTFCDHELPHNWKSVKYPLKHLSNSTIRNERITGGEIAYLGQFSWHVLVFMSQLQYLYICGASLISNLINILKIFMKLNNANYYRIQLCYDGKNQITWIRSEISVIFVFLKIKMLRSQTLIFNSIK
jgi:hypothetical protein